MLDLKLSAQRVISTHEPAVKMGANSFPTLPTSRTTKWERQPTGAARFSTFSTFPTLGRVRNLKMLFALIRPEHQVARRVAMEFAQEISS